MAGTRRKQNNTWKPQDAKARFSELVDRTVARGVQIVTRRGENIVAIVPIDEWHRPTDKKPTLHDVLLNGPKCDEFVNIMKRRGARRFAFPRLRLALDAMIAATADVHSLTVVTRNGRDFKTLGVKTVNPFTFRG